ncbi:glycoside hydrolase family 5 protein [Pholiota conissans]|uniref:Glycoside hydrolase family 5 protein n=1 Tax=Pholiota conissans TaxID=109636 RepID=A0A9P5ZBI4_9AGAR|nr:glycoside hydrolase family 5 protein [Pholiota conissans]
MTSSTPNHGSPSSFTTSLPHASTSTSTSAPLPTLAPFDYANDKIRGVNIGGWLVLEPWITPSVFESTGNENVVDEFTLGQLVDDQTALSILTNHWETWITEDDFAQISAAGLNHVRIPIGYWSIPLTSSDTSTSTSTSPYTTGAWAYLLRALNWAQKHNIYVILDLHGAPGSQNGYDNSGQRTNNPVWGVNPNNITRTIDTLVFLAREVGSQVSVLELLNEGAGFINGAWATAVRGFFTDAYGAVRNVAGPSMKIMIGDAFLGVNSWTNFLTGSQGQGVMMDFHEYQIFSDDQLDRSFDDHINFACTYIQSLTSFANSNMWTILGEWSNAVTDCAQWLNGRGVGARWDGTWFPSSNSVVHGTCSNYTGSYTSWTNDYKTFLRKYWEVQVDVGESVQGWVFWTWKAENADEWSYQKGLQGGWIPGDPTNRMYPGICS